jgi:hypothetical protein
LTEQVISVRLFTVLRNPMMSSYLSAHKQRYRITLELDVMSDFNPHQIDWNKLFDLEPSESVESYVEDLSVRW